MLQQDLEDLELLGSSEMDASPLKLPTRNEALADALGVRKTPRKAVDDVAPVAPRSRSVTARSRQRNKVSNISLLSPLSRHDACNMDNDTTADSLGKAPPLCTLGPFTSLHPIIAISCLYEETKVSSQAANVFLASNSEGSGTLTIGLVCPAEGKANPNELKLYTFERTQLPLGLKRFTDSSGALAQAFGQVFYISTVQCIPCISAQPIHAIPVPPCFRPHQRHPTDAWNEFSTDIIVLSRAGSGGNFLSLHRAGIQIVNCAVKLPDETSAAPVIGLANAVDDRVDFLCLDSRKRAIRTRGRISMTMNSCGLCERVLQAIDAAFMSLSNAKWIELSLKIRADCVRLANSLSITAEDEILLVENANCSAIEAVLSSIFEFCRLGNDWNKENQTETSSLNCASTDWESLLASEFHKHYTTENGDSLLAGLHDVFEPPNSLKTKYSVEPVSTRLQEMLLAIHSLSLDCLNALDDYISAHIFDAIHLMYEDLKLCGNTKNDDGLRFLGSILSKACILENPASNSSTNEVLSSRFLDHYRRDLGDNWFRKLEGSLKKKNQKGFHEKKSMSFFLAPPCILSWIDSLISGEASTGFYQSCDTSEVNAVCSRTRSLIRIFRLLFNSDEGLPEARNASRNIECSPDQKVVEALIEEGFTDPAVVRDEFPAGVALPLLEVLYRCRSDPKIAGVSGIDELACALIGREDLRKNIQKLKPRFSIKNFDFQREGSASSTAPTTDQSLTFEDKERDGIVPLELSSSMLFPNDNRIREVGRLLRSSRPTFLSVPRAIEVSDHDYERMKQEKLLLLSRRVLALPVGRGMLTLGNLEPIPAEPLPLPDLCLIGRVPPTNAMLALDTTDCPTDLRVWPEFHNGVAAGLRLPIEKDAGEIVSKITRTWIVYNRPPKNSQLPSSNISTASNITQSLGHSHGGLLMALGLRGHLTTLEMTDIFDYLTQGTVTTTVGVLLGMAAK